MEYRTKTERLYFEGNEVIRYKLKVPYIEGEEKINDFFENVILGAETFCKGNLMQNCSQGDIRRMYAYSLICNAFYCENKLLSCVMKVQLCENGRSIFELSKPLNFDLNDFLLIPPKLLVKKYGAKGVTYSKKKFGEMYLRDGKIEYIK